MVETVTLDAARRSSVTKIVCWNMQHKQVSWGFLRDHCGDTDIALLQEVSAPPEDVSEAIEVDPEPFRDLQGRRIYRTAIAKLSDRVQVEWLKPVPIAEAQPGDFVASHPDCISAAIVTPLNGEPFTVVSICAAYEKPHHSTEIKSRNILDASAHRVISDVSLLIGRQRSHRIIAAGDLTIWYGYGSNEYWKRRHDTVFDRMAAMGLPLVGPSIPKWPSGRSLAGLAAKGQQERPYLLQHRLVPC